MKKMKKLFAITTLLLICIGINVMAGVKPSCYVKTGDKTIYGQKIKIGAFTIKVTSDNGSVEKVPMRKVKSYTDGFRYFELLPEVNERYDTTGFRMMEYVKSKNGLKLFTFYNSELENPGQEIYVFTDERLYLKLVKKNAANVLAFFELEAL
jgi:hypothetical protein